VSSRHKILMGNPLLMKFAPAMETWNATLIFAIKAINARTEFKKDEELHDAQEQGLDMLSRWRNVKASDPNKMSTRDIVVHLSTNVLGGSDTTAVTLRAVVYYLCRAPETMRQVVAEIDKADEQGLLSEPVQYKEVMAHLPLFCAVIKEAMRMHPTVGLIMERHVPAEGAIICDKQIPGNTIVGINPWVLNYDPTNFERPEIFDASRWLEGSKEELQRRENILGYNFGAGARGCIGRHIALTEMHKVLAEILRRFEVSLAEPEKEWRTTNHWFVQQRGLICCLVPRKGKAPEVA